MLSDLFYEFDSIKLRRNGIAIFTRNKWKFWDRQKVHVSELIIKEIPQRIERLSSKFISRSHPYWRPDKVQKEVLKIINANDYRDVVEYLWGEYTKIKFPVSKMKPSTALITRYSHVKSGDISLLNVYNRYCNSLIRSSVINIDDLLSHIKTLYKKQEKKVIKLNLKRILSSDYFPIKQLMAA
ncbi:MAG TPA: hypothetical protein VMZ29_00015 [Candidatus Bathyarchaeia archaeon]|nr:hypothetical protein [Candidatus Bathyarchaeia archaeon]